MISSEEEEEEEDDDDMPLTLISDYSEGSDIEYDDSLPHHYFVQSNKINISVNKIGRAGEMSLSTTMLSEEDDEIPLSLLSYSSEDSDDSEENPLRYHQHSNSNKNTDSKERRISNEPAIIV